MSKIKRFFISLVVTPERVRTIIASVLSWLMCKCIDKGAWDAISTFPVWLRKLADFIDKWNNTELPATQDNLIAELVRDAVTDEAVDRLLDTVTAMEAAAKMSKRGVS